MGEGWPTKRKRFLMNATFFVALVAFILTLAVVMLYKPGQPTAGDMKRLEQGMTPGEVIALLGEPRIATRATVTAGDKEEVWTYALPETHWGLVKEDYQLKFFEGRLDSWYKIK